MFYSLVTWGFFYVRLVGQPSSVDYAGITINSFGEVLILLAVCSLAYRSTVADTFRKWEAMSLKQRASRWIVCYVLPFHVLLNMNLIAYVPWLNINLGGYEDSRANAGTYIVYSFIGCGALYLGFGLLRGLYRRGVWKLYALLYSVAAASVLVSWALFPSTAFHLHHTMLGAFFIPITGSPSSQAALAQAVALGCFVQGYTRWGWSSYLDIIRTLLSPPPPPIRLESEHVRH
ncbi:hypothetical protein BBJ28_00026281 [Nothophytophthora sp. Chile5]|nr:hypothetical protein BBJ28_00026281 [Nothophytophthora sp. Chile5]